MVGHTCGHGRSNPQRAMNPNEIVMREVQPQRRSQILNALGEGIGQPGQAAQERPAVQVVSLRIARRNVLKRRVSGDGSWSRVHKL